MVEAVRVYVDFFIQRILATRGVMARVGSWVALISCDFYSYCTYGYIILCVGGSGSGAVAGVCDS